MTTRLAGVIGWPVAHSLSPRLHRFWLREAGIDGAYVPLAVQREDFATVVDSLRRAGFTGVNVTIPHKQAAFALAHDLDEPAQHAGAANLLLFTEDSRIAGRNTDAGGLAASLSAGMAAEGLRGRRAVLIGAGGAARAAVLALCELGVGEICILNRNPLRAEALARSFTGNISAQLTAALWSDWERLAPDAALLLNATSAGMAGYPPLDLALEPLPQSAAVCDIVYNPLETPLLAAARARGHVVIDGLGMLMHQAVPAFAAFYGTTPAVTAALRADLQEALRRDG
jgi:shikimate dehydrogenase